MSSLFKIIPNKKINVIHLRLETDAIKHWSKMNNMDQLQFKDYTENKYIQLIAKNISQSDYTIILSGSQDNKVITYLKENNYCYKSTHKHYEDREKNAIVDLLISQNCTNIFIGNFNFEKLNGSTFSYYICKLFTKSIKKICIDLDRIRDDAHISE